MTDKLSDNSKMSDKSGNALKIRRMTPKSNSSVTLKNKMQQYDL